MKIEIGEKRPDNFKEYWPRQYDIFSHFEYGIDGKYEDSGFMLDIHAPKNLKTGEGKPSAVAVCKTVRVNEEG